MSVSIYNSLYYLQVVSPSKYAASEEKKWTCSICSAGFPRLYKLKLHFMKHTGEKPFKV